MTMTTRKTLILLGLVAATFALGAAAVSNSMTGDSGAEPTTATDDAATSQAQSTPTSQEEPKASDEDEEAEEEEQKEELPREHPGVVVETFEQDVPEAVETGELDLRVDEGQAHVIGWDQPAYKIMVLRDEIPEDRNHDYETEVEFDDASSSTHLDLAVRAERSGTYDFEANQESIEHGENVELAIIAYVPEDVMYESIYACSGQQTFLQEAFRQLGELVGARSGHDDCMPASDRPEPNGYIYVQSDDDEDRERVDRVSGLEYVTVENATLDIRSGTILLSQAEIDTATTVTRYGNAHITDVQAQDLAVDTRSGAMEVHDVHADEAALETRYGNVNASALTIEDLAAYTRDGSIDAHALDVDAASFEARYGDLTVDTAASEELDLYVRDGEITVTGVIEELAAETREGDIHVAPDEVHTGQIDIASRHGTITVELPKDPKAGYDVVGQSDEGHVEIQLEDDQASNEGDGEEAHARSDGYEDKEIQVDVTSETRDGDIVIVEGDLEQVDVEQDPAPEPQESALDVLGDA